MNKITKSFALAAVAALTASMTYAYAESEASLQAGSSSSTMNSAQSSRETSTAASSHNNSMSANQQNSQATSANSSMGQSEAIGGAVNSLHPAVRTQPVVQNKTSRVVTRSRAAHSPRSKRSFSTSYMQNTIRQAARGR